MPEREADMAFTGAARERVLPVEGHLAKVRPVEAGDDPEQGRLAGAGWAKQRQELAIGDGEVDMVARREAAASMASALVYTQRVSQAYKVIC
jgi:hypothetical protein